MRTLQETIVLPVPAEKAWEVVGDITTDPRWRETLEVQAEDGGTQRGDRVTFRLELVGQTFDIELTASEVGPGHRLVLTGGSDRVRVFAWREITEEGPERCRVDIVHEIEFRGLRRVLGPLLARSWGAALAADLERLEAVFATAPRPAREDTAQQPSHLAESPG